MLVYQAGVPKKIETCFQDAVDDSRLLISRFSIFDISGIFDNFE